MKSLCVLLVSLHVAAAPLAADSQARVRPVDPWASETFDRAESRSALVRALVRELQQSDVIVHVATVTSLRDARAGMTRFVTSTGGYRYVRVELHRALLPDARAAILGHELQHAVEIARSTAASHEAIRALFSTIGAPVGGSGTVYDTQDAIDATQIVWRELRGGSGGALGHRR